jgi:hypothetical protein
MSYGDGSVYEGGWVKGKRHGSGICKFSDGSVYQGDFYEGNFHGTGKLTWSDGGCYLGEWKNGEIDGVGMEVQPNGSLQHDGIWRQGVPIRSSSTLNALRKHLSTDSPEISVES